MQLRITVSGDPDGVAVRVDGWLADAGVDELKRVLAATSGRVHLQLSDLRGADAGGVALLRELAGTGTTLAGLSPYLQLLLSESGSERAGDRA